MRLFNNQHCLFRYVEMARVTGVPMEYLLQKGTKRGMRSNAGEVQQVTSARTLHMFTLECRRPKREGCLHDSEKGGSVARVYNWNPKTGHDSYDDGVPRLFLSPPATFLTSSLDLQFVCKCSFFLHVQGPCVWIRAPATNKKWQFS